MTRDQDITASAVAAALVDDHGSDAPAYVIEQIEAARGFDKIAAWREIGIRVAALLAPKGRLN